MAILIDVDLDPDFNVMCSNCDVKFYLVWERKSGTAILSYCPFCGEELEDEISDPPSKRNSIDPKTNEVVDELVSKLRLTANDEWFLNKIEPGLVLRAANEIEKQMANALGLHQAGCEEYERAEKLQNIINAVLESEPHYDPLSSEGSTIDSYELSVGVFQRAKKCAVRDAST